MANQFELDTNYLKIAKVRSELSRARRLKVGSILVKGDFIISDGFNGTPSGMDNNCEYEVDGELVTKITNEILMKLNKLNLKHVFNQIPDQVLDQVKDQVCPQVKNQVWSQLTSLVSIEIRILSVSVSQQVNDQLNN